MVGGGGCGAPGQGSVNAIGKLNNSMMQQQQMGQMAQQMGQMQQGVPGAQMGQMGPINGTPQAAFMQGWNGAQPGPMQVGMEQQFAGDDAMMAQQMMMQPAQDQWAAEFAGQMQGGPQAMDAAWAQAAPMQANPIAQQRMQQMNPSMMMQQNMMMQQQQQQNMMQQNMMMQQQQQQNMMMQQQQQQQVQPQQQQQPQQEQPQQVIKPIKELPFERDLDEAQTRRLTANVVEGLQDDPKMRGSLFIEFIHKMSTGELEIKDGELIHHNGPQMLPGTNMLASQFDTGVVNGNTVVNADDWAQEFAQQPAANQPHLQQQNLGPWAKPSPANLMPQVLGDGVVAQPLVVPTYAEDFNQKQTDWAEEFTDGDALCLNPNPLTGEPGIKHKFTLPNPFQDEENPYDTAMGFYAQGDLPNAILAFEAELMKNGNNEDAKFQLASAIILAKS